MKPIVVLFVLNIRDYINHEVNARIKYLNTFILLAFLIGQVQYAYTSYFCTLKHEQVKAPTLTATPVSDNDGNGCEECQGVIPETHGQQSIESNCIKVVSIEKSTIDNFAEWAKFHNQVVAVFNSIQANDYPQQIGHQSFVVLSPANSPPLDLPTLNSNLRI